MFDCTFCNNLEETLDKLEIKIICRIMKVCAVRKHVNLVDLVKTFPTNILLQNLASIQKRTSPMKFAHLAEKSERMVRYRTFQLRP